MLLAICSTSKSKFWWCQTYQVSHKIWYYFFSYWKRSSFIEFPLGVCGFWEGFYIHKNNNEFSVSAMLANTLSLTKFYFTNESHFDDNIGSNWAIRYDFHVCIHFILYKIVWATVPKRCNPIITTFYDFHTSLKLAQNKTDLLSSEIFKNKRKIQGDPKNVTKTYSSRIP